MLPCRYPWPYINSSPSFRDKNNMTCATVILTALNLWRQTSVTTLEVFGDTIQFYPPQEPISHIPCVINKTRQRIINQIFRELIHSVCLLVYLPLILSKVQSTLVISNSKGFSEILRDIRSSTYQVCRIEEKIIWLTTFSKLIGNWTFEVRDILKILWKRGEIAP